MEKADGSPRTGRRPQLARASGSVDLVPEMADAVANLGGQFIAAAGRAARHRQTRHSRLNPAASRITPAEFLELLR